MKDIPTIKTVLNQLFPNELIGNIELLKGGMSNSTYVVTTTKNKYTIRIPNEYSHLFTNWKREEIIYNSLSSSPLIPKLYSYSVESGIKVSQYVESIKPMEEVPITEVESFLEELQSNAIPKCNYEFCLYRLELFESYVDHNQDFNFAEYGLYKDYLINNQEMVQKKMCFCHGDFQPSNLIYTKDGLKMLDLEFSGIEDEIYDIACFGNWDDTLGLNLLKEYSKINYLSDLNKYYYWRLFLSLQWFNVAVFKEQQGLSEQFNMSFKDIAILFLVKAKMYVDFLKNHI